MKIGKLSWLFLIIGVVVIAALSLAMTHSSQTEQQNQLQSQLKDAQQKVASLGIETLTAKQSQINQDLAGYTAQINSTKSKLTSDWDGIDAIKQVLDLAAVHNLYVTSIKSSPPGTEQLGGAPCDTLALDFQIQGAILDMRDFVMGLSQKFPTSIAKAVQIATSTTPASTSAAPGGADGSAGSPGGVEVTKGTVHLVIYNYGGN